MALTHSIDNSTFGFELSMRDQIQQQISVFAEQVCSSSPLAVRLLVVGSFLSQYTNSKLEFDPTVCLHRTGESFQRL